MIKYYSPKTKLLHTRYSADRWSIGTGDFAFIPRKDVSLPAPPPQVLTTLLRISDPAKHPDILEPFHQNGKRKWKVIGSDIYRARPRGWHTEEEARKLKEKESPMHKEERITGFTILDKKCCVCSAPATIEVATILPKGVVDIYEGAPIIPGSYRRSFCTKHSPINIEKEREAWRTAACQPY